ncbi:rhomboid family intramembrane serine protease [Verrucomicrobiales bacterium]|jgi:hypothetical protein|nr:rhomboid family intramembrane serine protease [Verrucomicrobiales bacterium]
MCYIAEHRLFMWQSSYNPGQRPLFYLGALPIYATTLIILIHVVLLIVTAIFGLGTSTYAPFSFTAPEVVEQGKLWKLVTYAFYNPRELIVFVAIGLVFFYLFGIQVEQYLGTRDFLKLYGTLVLLPPVLFCLLYLVLGRQNIFYLATSSTIDTCIFLAFAFLYPNRRMLFGFVVKWFAAFIVAVYTLQLIAIREWLDLFLLWLRITITYVALRKMGLTARFPNFEASLSRLIPKRKPKGYRSSKRSLKVVKKSKGGRKVAYESKLAPKVDPMASSAPVASIDHLLEKISKEGISSLSDKERKQLENASSELLDDEKPSS